MTKLRTASEVREELERKGVSVTAWATANGFNPNLVHEILAGRRNPTYGQSHKIAVLLGLKHGEICNDPRNALAA